MDQLSMGDRRGSDSQVQLGTGLATIHSAPSTWKDGRFGFPMDGCCGALAQPNNPEAKEMNWCEFWAEYRLNFQLSQCRSCSAIQEAGAKLLPRLGVLFDGLEDDTNNLEDGNESPDSPLSIPFFEVGDDIAVAKFNKYRQNYRQFRKGKAKGAKGEVTKFTKEKK